MLILKNTVFVAQFFQFLCKIVIFFLQLSSSSSSRRLTLHWQIGMGSDASVTEWSWSVNS